MEEFTNKRQHIIVLVISLNILMYIDGTSAPISGFSKPDMDTLPSGCLSRRMTNASQEDTQNRHCQRDHYVIWVVGTEVTQVPFCYLTTALLCSQAATELLSCF